MKGMTKGLAGAAMILAAQPCFAAEDFRVSGNPEQRSGTFAGASVRLALGGRAAHKPEARLQAGFTHSYRDMRSAAPTQTVRVASFELGASKKGKPTFYMGGRSVAQFERQLGMSTGGAIAIGAGVTLLALLAVAAASDPPDIGCSLGNEGC